MNPSTGHAAAATGVQDASGSFFGPPSNRQAQCHAYRSCQGHRRSQIGWARAETLQVASAASTQVEMSMEGVSRPELSIQYTGKMQQQMGSPLEYRHQDGMNYTRIWDDVIVGSCLQTARDVDRLVEEEGVRTILCLQEDSDLAYFGIDGNAIQEHCSTRGDVNHIQCGIKDFDALDLQQRLPKIVALLSREHSRAGGTVYIHCTAGLGRAPGVAIAYMYWCRGWKLKDAVDHLVRLRYCGPKVFAIRQATCDTVYGEVEQEVQISVRAPHQNMQVQIAGLDFGWDTTVNMDFDPTTQRFETRRLLRPGRFLFKFVIDGNWLCSTDYSTDDDGHHRNNYIEVASQSQDAETTSAVNRLLSEDGSMTAEERQKMAAALELL